MLSQFAETRTRLYWMFVALNVTVASISSVAVIADDAVAPIWPQLADAMRFVIPGLPASLLDVGMMFPVPAIGFGMVIGLTYRICWRVKVEEHDYAFRAAHGPAIPPSRLVRFIICIAPPVWFAATIVAVAVTATATCWLLYATTWSADPPALSSGTCGTVQGPCSLGSGETATVMVVSNRKRNRTGLILARGEYTARHVRHDGWRDGGYLAQATGVELDGFVGFLARWLAWLRPYPQGDWFQVVGRIDQGRDVFPILDASDATRHYRFQVPHDGELVLLVNDVFYRNNSGVMVIEIGRPVN